MHQPYDDIRSRIDEEPKWFDEEAVPRYSDFHPDDTADIYANEVALVLISCQACGYKFKVAFSNSPIAEVQAYMEQRKPLKLKECIDELYYGDPPNINCCPAGPTMSSDTIGVLEYWERNNFEWIRNSQYEKIFT